jgi:hypothetical protein
MLREDTVGDSDFGEVATHGIPTVLKFDRRTGQAKLPTRRRGGFGHR